jgi:hypothetical protein
MARQIVSNSCRVILQAIGWIAGNFSDPIIDILNQKSPLGRFMEVSMFALGH